MARYGKQDIVTLLDWPLDDLRRFDEALQGWLELEHRPVKG